AAVPVLHHLVDVGAELADDHAATGVGDHRELVVLLADDGAHRRAEEHGVHLVAGALQRALDDVERDRVDLEIGDLGDAEFFRDNHCSLVHSLGVIRMLKFTSTSARWPGRTTVVESNSVTIAGPSSDAPGWSFE